MDLHMNHDVWDRELLFGITVTEALIGFVVVIVIVSIINRIQRARMLK